MKKTIILLLALMLVSAFALVACGGSGAVDWTEAADYETQQATITGEIRGISNLYEEKGIAKAMVHLGGPKAEDHFNVTFVLNQDGTWPDYLSDIEGQYNDDLIGKTMEVTGTISLNSFESVYEILVNDADDNTLPDDAATATWVIK